MSMFVNEFFDRWYCDPPYNEGNALKMYGIKVPSRQKLLKEDGRIMEKNSLMFLLLGTVNHQYNPKGIERIDMILNTVVPNNEIRTLNIRHKLN